LKPTGIGHKTDITEDQKVYILKGNAWKEGN
jgi:hypothetical protein